MWTYHESRRRYHQHLLWCRRFLYSPGPRKRALASELVRQERQAVYEFLLTSARHSNTPFCHHERSDDLLGLIHSEEDLVINGRPRLLRPEPESRLLTDQAMPAYWSSRPCRPSSGSMPRHRSRTARCCRAARAWYGRTCFWPIELLACRTSRQPEDIPAFWSLYRYLDHSSEASVKCRGWLPGGKSYIGPQ